MNPELQTKLASDFATIAELIHRHARDEPRRRALVQDGGGLSYGALDAQMDRVAAALQRDGVQPGDAIAICAGTTIAYAVTYLGALRAGVVVAPLAPGATAESLAGMLHDAQARLLFTDRGVPTRWGITPRRCRASRWTAQMPACPGRNGWPRPAAGRRP